ncbi:MAG: riboflavin synthase [Nannocystaceae bacterium]
MFTGLVQSVGVIRERTAIAEGARIRIDAKLDPGDRTLGASVAIDGVCLTVTGADDQGFSAEAAFETLERTTLGSKARGAKVNLEPALRLGAPLGGHLVSGHVDGVGELRKAHARGAAVQLWITTPPALLPFIAVKGSICVDGVSLTVNEVDARGFSVGVIPHTLAVTTLGARSPGDAVNLEVDLIARYVARLRAFDGAGTTVETLTNAGFLDSEDL